MWDNSLTVIVPVYNEQATVDKILTVLLSLSNGMQVIVVDDGSTDGTRAILEKWRKMPAMTVLTHSANRGKTAAIRTAIPHITGRFTIIQDADLEYFPKDFQQVLSPLVSAESRIVYGSRFLHSSGFNNHRGLIPWLGLMLLNVTAKTIYGCRLTDLATCYKAFSTDLLREMNLESERFEFCAEVTAKACRLGVAINEVSIRYEPRSFQQGKKITWLDGVAMLRTLWKYRRWSPAISSQGRHHPKDGR